MDFENCYADRLAQAIEKKDSRLVVLAHGVGLVG